MLKYIIIAAVLFVQLLRVECLLDSDSCNAEKQSGICRPLGQCPELVADIRRAGKPMPRYMRKKLQVLMCGLEGKKLKVCCFSSASIAGIYYSNNPSVKKRDEKPEQIEYSLNENVPEQTTRETVIIDDNDGPKDIQNHTNLHLLPTQCGEIEGDRILGGQTTNLFEMPWMVILSYHSERGPSFGCGGTLINERYVLTAAHCVSYLGESVELDGAILGEYDVRTDPDCTNIEGEELCASNVRNSSIEQVIAHPGFTHETLINDIALIRLAQPADFSLDSMMPICLPLTHALQTESLVKRNGVVVGWGITEEGMQSSVLLKVDLPVVAKEDCNAMYKGAFRIINKQICAGAVKDKGSCGSDSGGPLMYPGVVGTDARYVQRGIVSFGPKHCGISRYPGVYTNVAYYMDWILDHIRS